MTATPPPPQATDTRPRTVAMPLGVVVRRRPGVTRWATWSWHASAVLPFAPTADWKLLRRDGETAEYHATTLTLRLHRADVEGYLVALSMTPPSVFVVMRPETAEGSDKDVKVHTVTASAYEAQDYLDSGAETVSPVPMPEGLVAWIRDFVDAHFEATPFVKRRRDRERTDRTEDGVGDARIRQAADVYRAPGALKPGRSGSEGGE